MEVKTGQDYIEEFFRMDEEATPVDLGVSEVTNFYDGFNVFITGGSGFLGKLLIEKVLRCTKVNKLYMLLRPKKGKTTEERFKAHFDDPLYERLKREKPDFAERVVAVNGETGAPDLGLSPEDREMIRQNTNVIFHSAATVRFDAKLRLVVNTNVRGTKLLMELAKEMPQMKAFVHISTAFSHCRLKYIEEKYYTPPLEADKLMTLTEILDDDALDKVTPHLLDKFPNTYAYSKAAAEDVVQKYGQDLPICIVRPSIVISTSKDPIPGWINNLYGPTGVVVGAGFGLLRALHCEGNKIADIIPGDYVINNIVVAAWDTAMSWEKRLETSKVTAEPLKHEDPIIYNSVSSVQNPITWYEFMHLNAIYGVEVPSPLCLWIYYLVLHKRLWEFKLCIFFLHLVPAAIVDFGCLCTGRKPILLKAYKKIHKFSGVISYFSTQQWKFSNDNVIRLYDKLTPIDKINYDFHVASIDWDIYFQQHIRGLRVYLVHDPMDSLEEGKKKYRKMEIGHFVLTKSYLMLKIWLAWKTLNFLFWLVCLYFTTTLNWSAHVKESLISY